MIERLWQRAHAEGRRGRCATPRRCCRNGRKARGLPTPAYREVERTGPDHDPEFRVAVAIADRAPAEGIGRSKRAAEQAAAAAMLAREGVAMDAANG